MMLGAPIVIGGLVVLALSGGALVLHKLDEGAAYRAQSEVLASALSATKKTHTRVLTQARRQQAHADASCHEVVEKLREVTSWKPRPPESSSCALSWEGVEVR